MELQDSVTHGTRGSLPLLGLWGSLKNTADDGEDSFDSEHRVALQGTSWNPAGRASSNPESTPEQVPSRHESSAALSERGYSQAPDEELLAAAKASDDRAFEELSSRYIRAIRKRVYSIVRNPEDAEDVVQDSLLKAYRHLSEFRGSCEFSRWITRIAINTALMVLRKRRSRPEVSLYQPSHTDQTWTMDDFADPSPSTERAYARREMLEFVTRAVNRLPPLYRNVVEQYHTQENSMQDAAESLGITVASAKSRLFRARRTLRARLERQQISAADACY